MTLFGEPHGIPGEAYIMIPPNELKHGKAKLEAAGLELTIVHEDLQK